MNKAIYSIQDRSNHRLIYAIWDSKTTWTANTHEAARWCTDCKQAAYDDLPDDLRQHCMVVVNTPRHDGWEYLCRNCENELEL